MNGADSQSNLIEEIQDLRLWFEQLADIVCNRIAENQRIRRTLPHSGRLKIDRQLPFLCVYRQPQDREDAGTRELITSEAAYLFFSNEPALQPHVEHLCERLVATLGEHFGTFLLLEVWSLPDHCAESTAGTVASLACEVHVTDQQIIPETVNAFVETLEAINVTGQRPCISVKRASSIAPPQMRPLQVPDTRPGIQGLVHLGLAVRPIYRDPQTGALYPVVLRELRHQLSIAIRKAVAAFTGDVHREGIAPLKQRQRLPTDYRALGQSAFVRATSLVDQQLGEISAAFDFLLQVTPVNTNEAWKEFQQNRFRVAPDLYYRPLPYFPHLMKRRLFEIAIEQIEDTTLSELFWEKQAELDRQLTALQDLDTEHFRYSSSPLYGQCDAELVSLAEQLLSVLPEEQHGSASKCSVGADRLSQLARREIERYHRQHSDFVARVEISDSIAAGVMVVQNRLLISRTARVLSSQVEALLHHEVGTHVLTYCNGQLQGLHLMHAGLAGYEELQEGLAVFAELLGGGLTAKRMRTLACRVVAANMMLRDESFLSTFHHLHDHCRLPARSAFTTTVRVYRGGGFSKDIIYLRGLRELLDYLRAGHEIEPLYVGKLALRHVPAIQELRRRSVLQPPAVLPRFLKGTSSHQQIERCRGLSVIDLAKELV
jgi:uncharacterized protein (TIGR02421 family)